MDNAQIKYSKNFLSTTILRVDFTVPLDNLDRENLLKIKTALAFLKVEVTETPINNVKFSFDDKSSEFKVAGIQATYNFVEPKGRFVLRNEFFAVELDKYTSFESLRSLFNQAFTPCAEILGIKTFKRIGLRYINSITKVDVFEFSDWGKFIKLPYVPLYEDLRARCPSYTIRKSMNNFVISNGEYLLNTNFGIWNDDFPKQITDPKFIIDIDCSIDNMIIELPDFQARLPSMNNLCLDLFREFITEEFENSLK